MPFFNTHFKFKDFSRTNTKIKDFSRLVGTLRENLNFSGEGFSPPPQQKGFSQRQTQAELKYLVNSCETMPANIQETLYELKCSIQAHTAV